MRRRSIKWAPDGSRVAFVQRDDSGEKGALYYVDANNPKPAVLVAQREAGLTGAAHQQHQRRAPEGSGAALLGRGLPLVS